MSNNVATWLWLIGNKNNAIRLRARLTSLKSPPLDQLFGPEPLQCPLTVLYGAEVSRQVYANGDLRPALDAWDTGEITPDDLRRWCLSIEKGEYATDFPFDPGYNASLVKTVARTLVQKLVAKAKVVENKLKKDPRKNSRKVLKAIDWDQID